MKQVGEVQILEALRKIQDPDRNDNIVALNMISGVVNKNGNVGFTIEVDSERGPNLEPMRKAAEEVILAIPGVLSVTAVLTAPTRRNENASPQQKQSAPAKLLEDIPAVIAVASGKGGVGKSTTTVNLAVAMAQAGHRTGILDADIYGPSLPLMLGIKEKPESPDGKRLIPIDKFGLKCMSIGFMVPSDDLAWTNGYGCVGTNDDRCGMGKS